MTIPDPAPDLWKLVYGPHGEVLVEGVDYVLGQGGEPMIRKQLNSGADDPEYNRAVKAGLPHG